MKQWFILALVFVKLAVVSLGAAEAVNINWSPDPGCFPTDPCDS